MKLAVCLCVCARAGAHTHTAVLIRASPDTTSLPLLSGIYRCIYTHTQPMKPLDIVFDSLIVAYTHNPIAFSKVKRGSQNLNAPNSRCYTYNILLR